MKTTTTKTTIEAIAAKFNIYYLDARNSDGLDFHDLHCHTIKAMLEAAYEAGRVSAAHQRPGPCVRGNEDLS